MGRVWRLLAVPAVTLASQPCVKDSVLAKDPLLPAPAAYVSSWTECQKKCQAGGPLCDSFSFKEDSVPINGGCWLFPKTAQLQEVEDPQAFTGPKECEAVAVAPVLPDVKAPEGGEAAGGLRGFGVATAAAHSFGVLGRHEAPGVFAEGGKSGKTLVAGSPAGNPSNLAAAAAFGAAAVAVGAYFMLPRKKTKRGLKVQEEEGRQDVPVPSAPSSVPLVEPPQLMYPGAPVAYMPQMLQPMAMQQPGGEYVVMEPVGQMQNSQYVYEQFPADGVMAYQPVDGVMAYQPVDGVMAYQPVAQ